MEHATAKGVPVAVLAQMTDKTFFFFFFLLEFCVVTVMYLWEIKNSHVHSGIGLDLQAVHRFHSQSFSLKVNLNTDLCFHPHAADRVRGGVQLCRE